MANLDEIQIKISQDSSDASKAIDSLISSLEKLSKATELGKTAENIKSLSGSVDSLSNASKKLGGIDFGGKMKGFASTTVSTLKSLAGWGVSLTVIGKQLANSIGLASKYTQTVNMLNTVMGDGADEAKEFAEELGNVLGLNPADVMNFQATFQNLFVGFGNNAKQAQIMSKNLTQLSYDMAAFYEQLGGDPEAAAEKLRLAMAGTIEPIQRLGYAIKEADLQAVAARQGLNVNIRNLNTASKSMLRYIAVMEQSNHVQGYMVKSFSSPTTAIILFKSAIKQLSTEIGKTFLPMLMAIIPYMQAFVTGVLNMVKTLNNILGIELPTINWDEQKEGISGIGDEATETGKKMKKAFMLGIDELNVLDNSADSAGAGMQDITGQLTLPEYDMLEGFSGDKVKEIEEMLKPLEPLFNGLAQAFAGFYEAVSWIGEDVFYPWLVSIGEWMADNPNTMWLIGQGLGYIGAGLLTLKVLGGLGSILGLPNLFKKMGEGMKGVYEKAGKKLAPTLKTLALRLAGVAALTLSVYSAMQIAKTVIDIKNGDVQGWEAFRQIIGWTAIGIGSLTIGLFALGVTGVTAAAALAGAMAIALGAVLVNWDDFALRIQVSAAYISRFVWTVFAGLGAALLTIFETLGMLVAEAIQGVVWLALKGIELFSENVLKNVKSVAEIADKILGTQFASKVTTELDLTSGMEKRMSDVMNSYTNSIKEVWGNVADFAAHDPYEDAYLQNAMAQYEEKQAKKGNKGDDLSAIEAIAKELKSAFGDYQAQDEEIKEEIKDLNGKQAQFADQTNEQIETQKITNEEIANLRGEIDSLKAEQQNITMPDVTEVLGENTELQATANELATTANIMQTDFNATSLANDEEMQKIATAGNVLQKATTNDILSAIKSVGSAITSALRNVEDACRNIKIEVHKHYGGGDGYASGGFPTSGEMFFAREDGLPEMVGRVGRQTAVMNNGQIADTMAQSLVRAMGQGGASQQPTVIENKLYLDGEVVYNNQQKIQRSKGYNLGMGVFANV